MKMETTEHAPVLGLQQAWRHDAGVQVPLGGPQMPVVPQAACVVMEHPAPVSVQHGPEGGQGLGLHATPVKVGEYPTGQRLPPKICRQAPVVMLQQARTQGLGVHEVAPGGCQLPLQVDWKVVMQMIVPFTQQMPRGGQGVGEQDVPGKGVVLDGQEELQGRVPHAPVLLLQQTWMQGLGLQAVLAVHWPLHAAWGVWVQVVAPWRQHAPKGGQGLGLHEVAPVGWVNPVGQTEPATDWHEPLVGLQQMMMGGMQLLTEAQVVPVPCHWPGAGQAAAEETMVQTGTPAALTVQHAPQVGTQTTGGRQVAPAV
jgi:hypothetical protein